MFIPRGEVSGTGLGVLGGNPGYPWAGKARSGSFVEGRNHISPVYQKDQSNGERSMVHPVQSADIQVFSSEITKQRLELFYYLCRIGSCYPIVN